MKTPIKKLALLFVNLVFLYACGNDDESQDPTVDPNAIIEFTDQNFKAALLEHGKSIIGNNHSIIDSNNDGEIQIKEALAYDKEIYCPKKEITNLKGIEFFTNVNSLYVYDNQLSNLDLSYNTKLTYLNVSVNKIKQIQLPATQALIHIDCSHNQIQSLDISKNINLEYLNCMSNKIETINISKNVFLSGLYLDDNLLTEIDVSNNETLIELTCNRNYVLNKLDVSKNKALIELACFGCEISTLNLSNNTNLKYLNCSMNEITQLDLSKNFNLKHVNCRSSVKLTTVSVANGNNDNLETLYLDENPNLKCIQIDSGFNPPSSLWDKDSTASYSYTTCP